MRSLPLYYWRRVAALVSGTCSECELRVDAMRAAHCMIGYVHHDMFAQLERYPLSLTQGCISQNLDALYALPIDSVKEPTAKKIALLLSLGFPREQLRAALGFLRDELPCTTDLVEQGHGSGACLRKFHGTYCEKNL